MTNEYNAADLVYSAIENEAATATREEINGEWHKLRAWQHVHSYTDGTNVSADEFRAAFRAEFPAFDTESN